MQAPAPTAAPFPVEQLQADICTIFLLEARKIGTLTHGLDAIRWNLLEASNLYRPEKDTSEILTFDQIEASGFAQAMLDHYDFGFHAVTGTRSQNILGGEGDHTWFGAYLLDLSESAHFISVWDGFGAPDPMDAIKRCLQTIEMSNARCLLEGYEPLYHFGKKGEDDWAREGELTIRQLAMLADMEEMSLRSIISRKTPPVLDIRKLNRNTVIDAAVAREWLKAKGRYLPVRIGRRTADLDLTTTQFNDVHDLRSALQDRLCMLCDRDPAAEGRLAGLLAGHDRSGLDDLHSHDFGNESLMHDVARALNLPSGWLFYRAQEAHLKTEIAVKQHELKSLVHRQPKPVLDSQ